MTRTRYFLRLRGQATVEDAMDAAEARFRAHSPRLEPTVRGRIAGSIELTPEEARRNHPAEVLQLYPRSATRYFVRLPSAETPTEAMDRLASRGATTFAPRLFTLASVPVCGSVELTAAEAARYR